MTHRTSFTAACEVSMIAGVATVTIVMSTRIMKKPRHRASRAGHGRISVGGGRVGALQCVVTVPVNTREGLPTEGGAWAGSQPRNRPA